MVSKMFASLKNKIREETGNDVPRLFSARPRSPRQGSVSSLGSVVSGDVDNYNQPVNDQIRDRNSTAPKDEQNIKEILARERELTLRLDRMEREHAQMLEKRERQHILQLEEKEREWQEKITSLQNNMQAAQAVWSGEAAAARREAREEIRRSAALAEKLAAATSAAARAQDRLDILTEDIDTERRGWAMERVRLAAAAEDALHQLSLAETPSIEENATDGSTSNEIALKRKLEEAQLHLHDIKTSWSGQIAALETQVGRLSRQAGEEGSERRRVEKERDSLLERLREKEIQLEQAQATLEDKDAKMAMLAAEAGEACRVGRDARSEAIRRRDMADSLANKLSETEQKLTDCQEQIDSQKIEIIDLKDSIACSERKNENLQKESDVLIAEKKQWADLEQKLLSEIIQQTANCKKAEGATESEKLNRQEMAKEAETTKDQMDSLKHELNEIHDRYDKERRDKDECLLRNAHMSQTLEIYRQEMRQQEVEVVDYKAKVSQLEKTLSQNSECHEYCHSQSQLQALAGKKISLKVSVVDDREPEKEQIILRNLRDKEQQRQNEMETLTNERDNAVASEKKLQDSVKDLNIQITEKTKNIRVLQNRLTDMRKTLQRELRGGQVDPLGSSVVEGSAEDPDVGKKYLKHVLIKFLTSREMEARQLTRAVSALLGLSEQEEALLRDTLAWRSGLAAWLAPAPPRFPHS